MDSLIEKIEDEGLRGEITKSLEEIRASVSAANERADRIALEKTAALAEKDASFAPSFAALRNELKGIIAAKDMARAVEADRANELARELAVWERTAAELQTLLGGELARRGASGVGLNGLAVAAGIEARGPSVGDYDCCEQARILLHLDASQRAEIADLKSQMSALRGGGA